MGGKPSKNKENSAIKLSDTDLHLLKSNTKFSDEEIIQLHKDFINDCPSGKLTKKDFVKLFKTMHPIENKKSKGETYCNHVFRAFDKDNNGYIDFSEFVLAFSITSSGNFEEKVQLAFQIFDIDRNKKIEKTEMVKVMESIYDLSAIPEDQRKGDNSPKKKVDELWKKLDIGDRNYLTFQEFFDGCMKDPKLKEALVDPFYAEVTNPKSS